MSDFSVRSDGIDVERIMQQIRARIREKRGVDYTEDEIRELASVKLDRFLDPKQLRSGLVEQFREARESAPPETYDFEDTTIYESHRLPFLATIRRLLNPILKLFFNPNPIIHALHLQSRVNKRLVAKESLDYEVMSNLVLELTRLSVEVKNLRMRVESLSTRLDFDERRARALEGVVQLKPGALSPDLSTLGPERVPAGGSEGGEGDAASKAGRRRRRRRRRRPGSPGDEAGVGAGPHASQTSPGGDTDAQPDAEDDGPGTESSSGEDS